MAGREKGEKKKSRRKEEESREARRKLEKHGRQKGLNEWKHVHSFKAKECSFAYTTNFTLHKYSYSSMYSKEI